MRDDAIVDAAGQAVEVPFGGRFEEDAILAATGQRCTPQGW